MLNHPNYIFTNNFKQTIEMGGKHGKDFGGVHIMTVKNAYNAGQPVTGNVHLYIERNN
jgi:hypothetical protein